MRKFSQMAAAAMGMAKGTSADRPENPAVGDQFVNGTLGITEVYTENDGWQPLTSSSTGIPFGGTADRPDNDLGQPFFNGEESRLELFTSGTGWQNIVQETPGVVSVVGRYIEGDSSTTLTINGSNFTSGSIASAIGQDGTETIADTTQIVSVAQVIATFSGLSATNEPYDVKILNPSNLSGIAFDILQVDDIPVFITQSGSLGTYVEESPMSVQISVTDEEESPLVFSVSSGSLPQGLSLNTATGEISGTPTDVIPNTTTSFEISATDGNNTVTRNFSITVNDRGPTWQTAQTLSSFTKDVSYSYTLIATDDNGTISSYSIVSGALPNGLSLNSSTGEISGTPLVSDADYIFTVRATDQGGNSADRQFTIPNTGPVWITASTPEATRQQPYSYQLEAQDDGQLSYSIVSGALPPGLSMSSSGLISGTVSASAVSQSLTFRVTDDSNKFSDITLQIDVVSTSVIEITSSQSFLFPSDATPEAEVLAVGGGGGGGDGNAPGGGGGAGELITGTITMSPGQSYYITIGTGGDGGGSQDAVGHPGQPTSIGSILVAKGGGRGGGYRGAPSSGGSGGGGTGPSNYPNGAGAGSQGTVPSGCISYRNGGGNYSSSYRGGGGGGAGGPGSSSNGAGGAGFSSDISGTDVVYARGGLGAQGGSTGGALAQGYGSGGGGGGDSSPYGQPGNSGIVIIKYKEVL